MKLSDLPQREQQVIKLVRHGLSDKEIAVILEVEVQTAKNFLQTIYQRTETHSRIELMLLFYEVKEKVA